MLNHVSFKLKLLLIFLVPLASFAATSIYLINKSNSDVKQLQRTLYDTSYKAQSYVLNADRDMYQAMTDYQALHIGSLSGQSNQEALQHDFEENITQVAERINAAQALLASQEALINEISGQSITELLHDMEQSFNQWADQARNNIENKSYADTGLHEQFDVARSDVNLFGEMLEEYVAVVIEQINADNRTTAVITYSLLAAIVAIIAAVGGLLIRHMGKTVSQVLAKTKQVAEGNLRLVERASYGKDELGQILQAVDEMIGRMRELVGNISASTQTVAAATVQLTTSAEQSYTATTNVASHINDVSEQAAVQATVSIEVNQAMEEMAVGIQKIAEATTSISELALESNQEAEQGTQLIEQLNQQMKANLTAIQRLNERITELYKKSGQIGEITENISMIANQTSILSLNASIEAARAGEMGRGFAVVAAEIRKLAANSLTAAQHIAELIADTRNEIEQASQYMSSTVEQGEKSGLLVVEAAHGFQSIAEAVGNVSAQLNDASAITEQMSASSQEVSASMSHASASAKEVASTANSVAHVTNSQLAQVQSIHEAASSLQGIVGQLNQAVSQFKL